MDFDDIKRKAEDLVEERGGMDSVEADAEELKKIATGQGSLTQKAKDAAAAIKDPGAAGPDPKPNPKP
jgi:hypothetical protein